MIVLVVGDSTFAALFIISLNKHNIFATYENQ